MLEQTGINWQNRGCSFALDQFAINALVPGKKPFHTLNPALAVLRDGRTIVYGSMGGDGQPQNQAAVFTTRIVNFGMDPQSAVNAPRWLLGRTWGESSDSLKIEARFEMGLAHSLMEWGHEVEIWTPTTRPSDMRARSCATKTARSKVAQTRAATAASQPISRALNAALSIGAA